MSLGKKATFLERNMLAENRVQGVTFEPRAIAIPARASLAKGRMRIEVRWEEESKTVRPTNAKRTRARGADTGIPHTATLFKLLAWRMIRTRLQDSARAIAGSGDPPLDALHEIERRHELMEPSRAASARASQGERGHARPWNHPGLVCVAYGTWWEGEGQGGQAAR